MPEDRTPTVPLDRLKAFIAEGHYQLNRNEP